MQFVSSLATAQGSESGCIPFAKDHRLADRPAIRSPQIHLPLKHVDVGFVLDAPQLPSTPQFRASRQLHQAGSHPRNWCLHAGPVAHVAHDPSGMTPAHVSQQPPAVPSSQPHSLVGPQSASALCAAPCPPHPFSLASTSPRTSLLQAQQGEHSLSPHVGMPSQFQMSAPAAVANGSVQPSDGVEVMNGG